MNDEKETSLDEVYVWGVRDRTGYWHFYYAEERADRASKFNSTNARKFSFLEAHELHNGNLERMFSLLPISLAKFERVVEEATESFMHRLFHSPK